MPTRFDNSVGKAAAARHHHRPIAAILRAFANAARALLTTTIPMALYCPSPNHATACQLTQREAELNSPSDFLVPQLRSHFDTRVTLPGSKSIALRQLAISALVDGTSIISGVPKCDDTASMIRCLQALDVKIEPNGDQLRVTGPMDFGPSTRHLNAFMSGASTRLLIGLAALRQGATHIDGHSSLRARTNQALFDVLRDNGCQVSSPDGGLPAIIQGPIQVGAELTIDGSLSSQYVTALLVIAPILAASAGLTVNLKGHLTSRPYVDITRNEMAKRSVSADWQGPNALYVRKDSYQPGNYRVEGDATAASYFLALATLHHGRVCLTNLDATTHQGDYGFCGVMEQLGAQVAREGATVIQGPAKLRRLEQIDMVAMPDAALTLIAMAPLLPAPLEITGLHTLPHKECNRLECPAVELGKMGIAVSTTSDSIRIAPCPAGKIQQHRLSTYHDHRMAMSFSLLGSVTGTLTVDDQRVVDKTYPDFWQDFQRLS